MHTTTRTPSWLRIVATALLISLPLSLAGCATSLGRVRNISSAARAKLANAPSFYHPPAAVRASAETQRLRGVFEGALSPGSGALLRREAALDLVAAVIAEMYSDERETPTDALAQWLFWRSGATSTYSRVRVSWALRGDTSGRLDADAVEIARGLDPTTPTTYGVARFSVGRTAAQAIVLGHAPVEVDAFQKAYAPGAPLTLRMRPFDGYTRFVLLVDTEGGGVLEEPMERRADGSFFISRAMPTRPGRYFVEVRAQIPREVAADPDRPWQRTVLWVPLYVGIPEPVSPDDWITTPEPAPADPSAWAPWVVHHYDAERRKHGKRPLDVDIRLTAMANVRARELRKAGVESPPDPHVQRKLRGVGISYKRYHQSHSRFEELSEHVHMSLLHPSARDRLVFQDRLMIGLGFHARKPNSWGRVKYDVVEYTVVP